MQPIRPRHLSAFAWRATAAAALWWIVAEGRAEAWVFGVPLVAGAALTSLWLRGPRPWRPRAGAALGSLGWFLRRSLFAGLDVALRALKPTIALAPGFVALRTRLREPGARVLLADSLSLLPGTLCAELRGAELTVHVLDVAGPIERDVREIEERIAALLGVELDTQEAA
jgi:multicomponent Na+:H+ antiporter subunit E